MYQAFVMKLLLRRSEYIVLDVLGIQFFLHIIIVFLHIRVCRVVLNGLFFVSAAALVKLGLHITCVLKE